jgi:hypothetical protein
VERKDATVKVFVYYNLHKRTWSVKALEGPRKGRVIAHSKYVVLRNAHGKVSAAGRARVLREGRKNVHAGMVGDFVQGVEVKLPSWAQDVTYNPYKYETFVYKSDEEPFTGTVDVALLAGKRVMVA